MINIFLKKIGKIDLVVCFFCGVMEEFFEYFFVICYFIVMLWKEFLVWCNGRDINIEIFFVVDILFGDW